MRDFLDAIALAPTPVSEPVSQLVIGQWVIVSDFGDSYRIYRACELVIIIYSNIVQCNVFLQKY